MKFRLNVFIIFIITYSSFSIAQNVQEYLVSVSLKNNPDLNRIEKSVLKELSLKMNDVNLLVSLDNFLL